MRPLFLVLLLKCSLVTAQKNRTDTIQSLIKSTTHYLDLLVNQKNADSAMTYWFKPDIMSHLTDIYWGGIGQKENYDDSSISVYLKDDLAKLTTSKKEPVKFRVDKTRLVYNEDGTISFMINYTLKGIPGTDKDLTTEFLHLAIKYENSKKWQIFEDRWLLQYIKSLYVAKKQP